MSSLYPRTTDRMQFKLLIAVILLFVAQTIAAPSPTNEEYGGSSLEEYVCASILDYTL